MSQDSLPTNATAGLENPEASFDPIAAMNELKAIQSLPERSNDDIKRAVTLIRQLRRTNTGPAAAKGKKAAKTSVTSSKSLDDLLDL